VHTAMKVKQNNCEAVYYDQIHLLAILGIRYRGYLHYLII